MSLKEQLAKKRKAREARKKFISSFSLAFFLGLFIGLLSAIAVEAKIAIAIGGGITSIILSYQYPRAALWFFLIYMPLSGTVTYSIGGGNAIFQLAKDAFYFPALIALFQECKRQKKTNNCCQKVSA